MNIFAQLSQLTATPSGLIFTYDWVVGGSVSGSIQITSTDLIPYMATSDVPPFQKDAMLLNGVRSILSSSINSGPSQSIYIL